LQVFSPKTRRFTRRSRRREGHGKDFLACAIIPTCFGSSIKKGSGKRKEKRSAIP